MVRVRSSASCAPSPPGLMSWSSSLTTSNTTRSGDWDGLHRAPGLHLLSTSQWPQLVLLPVSTFCGLSIHFLEMDIFCFIVSVNTTSARILCSYCGSTSFSVHLSLDACETEELCAHIWNAQTWKGRLWEKSVSRSQFCRNSQDALSSHPFKPLRLTEQ